MLHISIESIDFPEYWIHILVYTKTTFRTLDNFLRDIWCECCGHLSGFWIDKPFGTARIGKRSKIGEILMPKMKFFYVYDFGTSTILLLKVHDMYQVSTKNRIILLARNYPPEIKCKCGNPAKYVCSICYIEDPENAFLCEKCKKEHQCEEEALLPVVNSPRMGLCGYEGSRLVNVFELYKY